MDIRCFTMKREFFASFPELRVDMPCADTGVPRLISAVGEKVSIGMGTMTRKGEGKRLICGKVKQDLGGNNVDVDVEIDGDDRDGMKNENGNENEKEVGLDDSASASASASTGIEGAGAGARNFWSTLEIESPGPSIPSSTVVDNVDHWLFCP